MWRLQQGRSSLQAPAPAIPIVLRAVVDLGVGSVLVLLLRCRGMVDAGLGMRSRTPMLQRRWGLLGGSRRKRGFYIGWEFGAGDFSGAESDSDG